MILEHGKDPVSAKWINDGWNVGEQKKYRWNNASNKPESEWFYDIQDALDWIIDYDRERTV